MRKDSTQRPGILFAVTCVVLVVAFVSYSLYLNYVSDDAFISFRYVKNLLQGYGPVFNPGERVEGYTNFLWVMILAGLQYVLPSASLLHIAQVTGITIGATLVVLLMFFSRQQNPDFWPFGWVGAALLAAHTGFAAWSTGALEGSLFASLLFGGAWAHIRYVKGGKVWWLSPILFALATMTRPDGVVFAAVTGIHLLIMERKRTGRWLSSRIFLWPAVFLAIFGPYFIWRFGYYGYVFPNTFYAKTSGIQLSVYLRGLKYLKAYFSSYGYFLPFLFLLVLFRRRSQVWVTYFSALAVTYGAYVVYVGGDGLNFFRFVSYIAPFLCMLAQGGIEEILEFSSARFPGRKRTLALAACTAAFLITLTFSLRVGLFKVLLPATTRSFEGQSELYFPGNGQDHSYYWFDNYFVDRLAIAAHWLEANAPPDSLVAATPAGSISYHMSHRFIDMLGLNDVHIAHSTGTVMGTPGLGRAGHEKGDGKYVLSRSPDYILMGNVAVLPFPIQEDRMMEKLVLKSEHEIWDEPSFHRDYELVSVHLSDEGLFRYFTFYRKKSLKKDLGQP